MDVAELRRRRRSSVSSLGGIGADFDDEDDDDDLETTDSGRRGTNVRTVRQGFSCSRHDGCRVGNVRILPASVVAFIPLVILLTVFCFLFACGLVLAFYLTNTAFAILDPDRPDLSVWFTDKTDSVVTLTDDKLILNFQTTLYTYVPSLLPIPVVHDGIEAHIRKLTAEPTQLTKRRRLQRSTSIPFEKYLLSSHQDRILQAVSDAYDGVPVLPVPLLDIMKKMRQIPKVSKSPFSATMNSIRLANITHQFAHLGSYKTLWPSPSTNPPPGHSQSTVEWQTHDYRRGWIDWENNVTDSKSLLGFGEQDPPSAIKELRTAWKHTLYSDNDDRVLQVTKKEPAPQKNSLLEKLFLPKMAGRETEKPKRPARAEEKRRKYRLETRGTAPASLGFRLRAEMSGIERSKMLSSAIITYLEACASEALGVHVALMNIAGEIEDYPNLWIGQSCGEQMLLEKSRLAAEGAYEEDSDVREQARKADAIQFFLGIVESNSYLETVIVPDDLEDPLGHLQFRWIPRGVQRLGALRIYAEVDVEDLVENARDDCETWGLLHISLSFVRVRPCIACTSVFQNQDYKHVMLLPCQLSYA